MKSFFEDLDQLIEQAVGAATNSEKSLQKKQVKSVEKRGIKAEKEDTGGVDEAEDDKKQKDEPQGDESIKKIKGKPPEEKQQTSGSATKTPQDNVTPGTRTSKKLDDPSSKTIHNPGFDDISGKVNALRGASSLKDEKISSAVKSYIGTLSRAERGALLTYLTNLAQIMAPVKEPKDVKDPSEVGIKINFKKSDHQKAEPEEKEKPKRKDSEPAGVIVVGGK